MIDIDTAPPSEWSMRDSERGRHGVKEYSPAVQSHLALISTSGWFRWLPVGIGLIALIFIGRLVQLQIAQGESFRQTAEHNRLRIQVLPAPRGAIVDRYGRVLVSNVPDFSLTITPADLPNESAERQVIVAKVQRLTALPLSRIMALISNPNQRRTDPVPIVEHVDYRQAIQWLVVVNSWPGVNVTAVPRRAYTLGPAAAAVIGYVGKLSPEDKRHHPQINVLDVIGKDGLERQYDRQLRGQDGQIATERAVNNQGQQTVTDQPAIAGQTLRLSLDRDLQQRLFDRLESAIASAHSTSGAAVAINPQNGEILAIVSAPSFDNNWFVSSSHTADIQRVLTDRRQPLLNRAIGGVYPSGSIIKPFIGTAALAEHVVTPSTTVLSTGGLKVGGSNFPDWKPGGHGVTNLAKAIADSVNTYFYEVGGGYQQQPGLGVDRIVAYLQKFGWGSPLGIDLPGEAAGLVPTRHWRETVRPTPWRLGDTYHLAIGQGDLEVTPLQVATAVAAVANGGTLFQPHLLTTTISADGRTTTATGPEILRDHLATAANIAAVQNGMRQGVLTGSSQQMQSVPVPVAGKTGTAQFGVGNRTHAWYTAYAPFDHPSIALAIVIEGGGQGHEIALPVAKDILTWYFTRPTPQQAVDNPLTAQ